MTSTVVRFGMQVGGAALSPLVLGTVPIETFVDAFAGVILNIHYLLVSLYCSIIVLDLF